MLGNDELVVVAGAGGFIGGHLVADLLRRGCRRVRAVDIKPLDEWYQLFPEVDNRSCDLRRAGSVLRRHRWRRLGLQPGRRHGRHGFHREPQGRLHAVGAHQHAPAAGRTGPWRPAVLLCLVGLRVCRRQADDCRGDPHSRRATPTRPCPRTATAGRSCSASGCAGTSARTMASTTRVARYHNVYGPHGTFDGGREKAPAAICRKVIQAKLSGRHEIEIWGDGEQTRSFMYHRRLHQRALRRIMRSHVEEPLNLGSDELVTINQLVDIVEAIAGVRLRRQYQARRAKRRPRTQQRQHADPSKDWGGRRTSRSGGRARERPTGGSTTRW